MASPKQVSFALHLLGEAGYSTKYMAANFKGLGATMNERGGLVRDWLSGMESQRISRLIGQLNKKH
ncbi:hypothetical protein ABC337_13910 [Arthrobacter sp. 1P04PC]|uniref:hypothetical protein n=1 Tax=unclassified Arthrobacter TaxID=235627 RepID=UPI0039A013B9